MKKIVLLVLCLCSLTTAAWAAEPVDFTYKTVQLGDSYEQIINKLGNTKTEIVKTIAGQALTYYVYQDTWLGISKSTGKLTDIRIGDKKYEARNGIKLGATPYKILKEFGKTTREHYNNQICYIYHNPEKNGEKLILDITEGYLREIRITDLDE